MDPSTGEGTPKDPGRRPKNSREVSGQSVVGGFAHPVPDPLRRKGPGSVGVRWDVLVLVT